MKKLTAKQELFVQEYLKDLNQKQAAIRAGYSAKSAEQIASKLMDRPSVRDSVAVAMAERSVRTGIHQNRVLRELARIAFANVADVVSLKDATILEDADADDLAAIASVRVKQMYGDIEGIEREVKLCDKIKALELLGKHLGMFADKLSITGELPVKIIDDVPHTPVVGFHTDADDEAGDEE